MLTNYIHELHKIGCTFDSVDGKTAFDTLKALCNSKSLLHGDLSKFSHAKKQREQTKGNLKEKSTPTTNVVMKPLSDESTCVHFQDSNKPKRKELKAEKGANDVKMKCPMKNHNKPFHEIGTCKEFWELSAQAKRSAAFKRLCYTCLGGRKKCFNGCVNYEKPEFPKDLICADCEKNVQGQKKTPISVVMCSLEKHSRPNHSDLLNALEKWFPYFDRHQFEKLEVVKHHTMIVAVTNAQACACGKDYSDCKHNPPSSKTSKPNPATEVPCFDSSTGQPVQTSDDVIISESSEDSLYIMQELQFGDHQCLTFFDSGSNQHVIEGDLAEKLQLKVYYQMIISLLVLLEVEEYGLDMAHTP